MRIDLNADVGESFGERFRTKTYDIESPVEYQHFRLDVTKNNGGAGVFFYSNTTA